ncbi:hypothetical protein HYZ78_02335 [Candidatus Microgenomates bacterium]|nr:hypothetical protein [Candidatus Microgenomates bacterium]
MNLLAHLLFPRSSNNYRAKIIKPSGLFILLIIFAAAQFSVGFLARKGAILGDRVNFTADQIISETNKKREEMGLPTLRSDNALALSAKAKGEDMIIDDYWAHVSPSGETPWLFLTNNGYQYKYAGENLARDFDSASEVVAAWISSPTHKENLFSAKYHDIGVAVVEGEFQGKPIVLVVQHFGTRLGAIPPTEALRQIQGPPITLSNLPQTRGINISQFDVRKNISVTVIGFLLAILLVDAVTIYRLKVIRISGRTLAHFGFLSSLVVLLFLITKGVIL